MGTTTAMVRRRVLAWALALGLSCAPALAAQGGATAAQSGSWGILNAVGYGGLGFGVGVMAASMMPSDDWFPSAAALTTIAATTVAGTWAGVLIGSGAMQRIEEGRALAPAHALAAAGGAILGGATLGALASVPLIKPDGEGTPLGSDETTFALLTGGGAALGALYVARRAGELWVGRVSVTPSMGPRGQTSLDMRVRF